jgi:DNA segregation ATPase FtsK/SpoIIIE, S-DNA-T family
MLELSLYNDIPHLLLPVVTDARKASLALAWAVDEMERRYQMLSDAKVRDIDGYNRRIEKLRDNRELGLGDDGEEGTRRKNDPWYGHDLPQPLPYIMVLIDEFADLMCVAPRDVEGAVQRLAQKARAAGIHVLLATQRPSTDVITGVIKNNFPSRISFRVASRHDSATILNSPGAENLLGMGDSLVLDVASPVPERVHGAYVSETEVERVVDFWKAQARPTYDPNILKKRDEEEAEIDEGDMDEMYDLAVRIVTETKKASISALQRKLRVGYNRAARMVEMMERQGIVGPAVGPKGEREVLVLAAPAD